MTGADEVTGAATGAGDVAGTADATGPEFAGGSCPFGYGAGTGTGVDAADIHHALRRRSFLRGAAVGAVGAAAITAGGFGTAQAVSSSGSSSTGSGRTIAFHGAHQAGILTPPQLAATFVSFNVVAADRTALQQMFRTLTDRARFLPAGGTPVDLGVASPVTSSAPVMRCFAPRAGRAPRRAVRAARRGLR